MRFDLITIFPEFFAGPLEHGIVRRARETGLVHTQVQDLRQFTHDKHRTVDDRPFGGGEGMVMKPEPLFEAVEALLDERLVGHGFSRDKDGSNRERASAPEANKGSGTSIVLLSASGKVFRQAGARRLAQMDRIVLICGRYEGVDERVANYLATDEFSIGDFVLSGGELPAAMIVDAVTRLIPGALGNEDSTVNESFSQPQGTGDREQGAANSSIAFTRPESPVTSHGILDYPHYTRPPEFRGWAVPEILLSGNHADIRRWRRKMALAKTLRNRPDLLTGAALSVEDRHLLDEVKKL